jgi:hypothetical protein
MNILINVLVPPIGTSMMFSLISSDIAMLLRPKNSGFNVGAG